LIFSRNETSNTWSEFGNLVPPSEYNRVPIRFGTGVALSSSGLVLAVAACAEPYPPTSIGGFFIFNRTNNSVFLLRSSYFLEASMGFGTSISLSGNGDTLAVGVLSEMSSAVGGAYIFVPNASGSYEMQGVKLTGNSDNIGGIGSSVSVSLSSSGEILALGKTDPANGVTYIFTRNNGIWGQLGPTLIGSDPIGFAQSGYAVTLSGDGSTLGIGGVMDNQGIGAVWIFTNNGTNWVQQGAKLVGTEVISDYQSYPTKLGSSVSLSYRGNVLVIGGPGDNADIGAVWVFNRSQGLWSQQGSKITRTYQQCKYTCFFGYSVAFSGLLDLIIVGAPQNANYVNGSVMGNGMVFLVFQSDSSPSENQIVLIICSCIAGLLCFGTIGSIIYRKRQSKNLLDSKAPLLN